jgi:uncharacterized protein (DUF433 family)
MERITIEDIHAALAYAAERGNGKQGKQPIETAHLHFSQE